MIEALRVVLFDDGRGDEEPATETALVAALDACTQVERAYVFGARARRSRVEAGGALESIVFLRADAGRTFRRARRLAWLLLRSEKIHLVICEHQRMLPTAWLLARLRRARLAAVLSENGGWDAPRSAFAPCVARGIDSFIVFDEASARRFSLWSGIPRDRSFLMGRSHAASETFSLDIADWLWGV